MRQNFRHPTEILKDDKKEVGKRINELGKAYALAIPFITYRKKQHR